MGNGKRFILVGLVMCSLCSSGTSYAGETIPSPEEKLPLYEYGIAGLAAHMPHYTGSKEYQTYAFPVPYFVYRGEVFKADRESIRGIFWHNRQFELDISLAGNPPTADDKARDGMDDLDALVEIGPALNYYFYKHSELDSFFLQASVRGAISFDFDDGLDVGHEGYVSDLSLILRNSELFKEKKIRFHGSSGVRFADSEMNGYFYDVARSEVTANRNFFSAESGYAGLQVSGSITKELTPSFSMSCYGRWINIDGAVFEESPLVDTHNNYIVGAMLVWKLGESEEREP
jgi:MipA family protein